MLQSRGGGSSPSSGKIFTGVRFVLFGFDSVSEAQYRSEIERRGGTDVGKYEEICTHVIVSGRVYDDPVCIAGRQDGKLVVTELWVDDSVDFGMLADSNRIIYRPVKDLNGIPGSESLYICLTGYQRQERDDIMKMVSLMGARFSKPLIANQVTHLICYKFEGEKYELAKKVKIKLVNHRWLVDCLKAWEILPIDNYTKSAWELEVLEAEARDSEEENDDPAPTLLGQRSTNGASRLHGEMPVAANSLVHTSSRGISSIHQGTPAAKPSLTADSLITNQKLFSTPCNETTASDAHCEEYLNSNVEIVHQEAKSTSLTIGDRNREAVKIVGSSIPPDALNPKMGSTSSRLGARCSTLNYSRRITKKEVMTSSLSREGLKENTSNGDVGISLDDAGTDREPDHCQNLTACSVLPQKRKDSDLSPASKSPKLECQESKISSHDPSRNIGFAQLEPTSASSVNHGHVNPSNPFEGAVKTSSEDNQHAAPSKTKSLSFRRSLKRSQPTQSKFSKSADSPSVGSAHDAHPRDALDQPRGVKNKLPVSEAKDSGAILSPSGDMVLGGKPYDDEAKREMEVDGCVEKCGSDSIIIDDRNKEVKTHKKVSKPKMACNYENGGDTVMKDLSKVIDDETAKLQRRERNEEAAAPPSREEKCGSDSIIIDDRNKEVKTHKKVSKPKMACNYENGGDTVMKDLSKVIDDETAKLQRRERNEEAAAPPSREEKCGSDSIIIDDRNKEVKTHKKVSKPKMACNYENGGDTVMKDLSKVIDDETAKLQRRERNEEAAAPPSREEKCGSDSIIIDDRNKEVKTHKKVSKPKMACNYENGGDTVMKDLSKVIDDETGKLQRRERNEEAAAPPSRDKETKKLSSSAINSACKGTVNNESSALRIKKVISRRNLSCKSKVDTSKDKSVNSSDKSATPKTAEVMPEKIEKLKARTDDKKASSEDEKEETVGSASKDVIMEDDKVKPKGCHLSATSSKKKDLDRIKASVSANSHPEKENKPRGNGISSVNVNSHPNRQFDPEGSNKNSWQVAKKLGLISNGDQTSSRARLVNPEPVWFILSGHRFQRKEFQSVIRRLRGRVCRDSHNWSYQATHFIVPDPVRRTEKFFAAAAAGRWILKTDYLTASNEAGKFLDEEPFEWYKKGLTEDGAISLEAPRKWRHLRERTGHGAFHKMRIIIYGECIAPTLDTLKRVVKAGDGSILATSPPYTRFFKTGVDFAIVSASMPRVDSWVQEFLRHEIPCVVADYLVEYVCKPGYPLDRHVLYNTNSLAEKSFANLSIRLEEIADERNNDDIKCLVCGSHDRGEVMLICEGENGSVGCGIGTH